MSVLAGSVPIRTRLSLAGTILSLLLWQICIYIASRVADDNAFWGNFVFIWPTAAGLFLALFILLLKSHHARGMAVGKLGRGDVAFLVFVSFVAFLQLLLILSGTVYLGSHDGSAIRGGGYLPYISLLISQYISIVGYLVVSLVALRNTRRYKGMKIVLITVVCAFLFGATTNILIPLILGSQSFTSLGMISVDIFAVGFVMSVVGGQLIDIKVYAVRTAAYLSSIATLAAVYFALAYLASIALFNNNVSNDVSISPVNIIIALILAFIFQPIKQFFDQVTGRFFYRNRYDTGDFLIRLGRILTSTTRLHVVLDQVGKEIRHTLKAGGSLFIVYRDHHPNALVGEGIDKRFSAEELAALDAIPAASQGSLLPVERLRYAKTTAERDAFKVLSKKHVALVLPLVSADETIGYLMLGEHMTGMYSKQDVAALNAIANELVIAVQNARSVQALRDLNAHLEQRIGSATSELVSSNEKLRRLDAAKDEFVSMASHQLRTPLTSVKGYISMVLEGDAGKITPMQKQLLEEAFVSSERMVHLIGDFLNVSRLQTGKFVLDQSLINLAELVDEEVDGLKATAEARDLKLRYRKPARFPSLYIDSGKIHQVIMNFIDNAIYYSAEDTTITIRLAVEGGEVIFTVEDTGIGVPKSEQSGLFTKFFRATNARRQRPDGTGIGLYLAKKVIDAHSGSMVFSSVEGKGSTFGFRLPIKKLSEPPSE